MSDFPGFEDDFFDLLKNMQPGRTFQLTRYRQGGDVLEYQEAGSYKYTDLNAYLQVGSREWSGAAATSGTLAWTMPATFSGGPLVFISVAKTTPLLEQVTTYANSDGAQIELAWWSANNLTSIWFHWLAYGPGSL